MEEKRRAALLTATKKLVAGGAVEQDIMASLQELGATADEAGMLLNEVRKAVEPPVLPPLQRKNTEEKEIWKESIEKRIQEGKSRYVSEKTSADAVMVPEEEFPKHFIGKGTGEEYVPELKKGGRAATREIIVESKIGSLPKRQTWAMAHDGGTERILIEKMSHIEKALEALEKEFAESTSAGKRSPKKRKAAKIAQKRRGAQNDGKAKFDGDGGVN